jgi:tripartite ATP-independent transporter DctP family solute receptor
MSTRRSLLAALAALILVPGTLLMNGGPAHAADFTLRLNHTLPAAHLRNRHAELFKQVLAKATDGAVDVQIFPAGQLYGNDQDAIKAVRSGAIEGAMVTPGDLSLFDPAFSIFEMPFFATDYKQIDALEEGPVGQEILAGLEKIGLKGLAYTDAGSAIILNSKHPVNKPADLEGLRIRASAGALQVKGFALLGASAIQLPFGEVAPSLQRGMIDAVYTTPSAAAAGKLGKQAKYVTWTKQQFFNPAIIVNLAWWNSLPKDKQASILAAMPAFMREASKMNQDDELKSIATLKSQGAEVIEMSADAKAALKAKLKPLYDEYRGKIGNEIFDKASKAVEAAE